MDPFVLHARLAADTAFVADWGLSRVLLMNDARYPWLILVPRMPGVVEIIDLEARQQEQLFDEMMMLSLVLRDVTRCDKLNIAAIGNVVAQLHVHIVARRKGDAAWPKPVWGAAPVRPYDAAAREKFIAAIRGEVAFG